jgi:hypothetical protein
MKLNSIAKYFFPTLELLKPKLSISTWPKNKTKIITSAPQARDTANSYLSRLVEMYHLVMPWSYYLKLINSWCVYHYFVPLWQNAD